MTVPAGYMSLPQYGAVALQLWDAARGARLRDRIDVVIEHEYPLAPDWAREQSNGAADRQGRPRFGKRTTHTHGLLYGRQVRGRPKPAIDVWLYDEAWRYTPRRLHVPVPAAPEPERGAQPRLRLRRTALFPGPAYGVTSCATGLRGLVEHVVGGRRLAVRWPRVIVPNPAGSLVPLAVAHGDHHGEFLLLLPPTSAAVAGSPLGELALQIEIAWQALPPYAAGSDPLTEVPLETVGVALGVSDPDMVPFAQSPAEAAMAESPDPVAMGWQLPSSYGTSIRPTVTFTAGRIHRDVFTV